MAIGTENSTIKTRIQLKSDTEENWKKTCPEDGSQGFIPLLGELIIYTSDSTHSFSRLKVGDGNTNVVNLPFIDASTINGEEVEIVKLEHYSDRPLVGSSDKLYIDLETNKMYHFAPGSGYSQLSNFNYTPVKSIVKKIMDWSPGRAARADVQNNTLILTNGIAPYLPLENMEVVTDIQKE